MKIEQIYKENKKGFTLKVEKDNITIDNSKEGYFVSITDNKINPKDIDSEFIKLLKLGNMLNLETFYIGFWNGYLDLTIKTTTEFTAFKIARKFNQQAIFNCSTQETINTKKYEVEK